jgi:predicted dehydrogenase
MHLDAVSICVPTSAHYPVASQALAQGLDVLLEKPIAVSLAEADALVEQAAATKRILQVGLLERFNPAVTTAEPLVNGPMFFEAHRLSVFHRRALDVDVVLDLMIHDLDIVLSLVRSPVRQLQAVGSPPAVWPTSPPAGSARRRYASCASSSPTNTYPSITPVRIY